MDKQALMQHLAAHGLQNYAQAAAPFARQAITLTAVPAEAMAVGASRLGGEPDLPDDMAWPYAGDKPMALIAQINFAEAKPFDADNRLPESLHRCLLSSDGDQHTLKLADYGELAFVLQALKFDSINIKSMSLLETDLEYVFLRLTSDHAEGAA